MRNLLLLLLVSSLLITSACKKTSTNPAGSNTYGTYTLGDSTYTVSSYSYSAAADGVIFNSSNTINNMSIGFVSPNIPPVPGSYPIGNTNPGQVSFGITTIYYGTFYCGNSVQSLTISIPSNGYLNYSLPTTWAYLNGNHSDSLPFSMNITIPR